MREASHATTAIAAGELSTRLPEPRPHRARRARRAVAQRQRHGRVARTLAHARAAVPAVGQPRPAHAAHVDPRLRRGDRRRQRRPAASGGGHPVRGAAARTTGRRPARPGQAAGDDVHLAHRADRPAASWRIVAGRRCRARCRRASTFHAVHRGRRRCWSIADHDRLAQVLANLVENAGEVRRTRGASCRRVPSAAGRWSTVDDDGPGIDPHDLPHVFERLYVARHAAGARRELERARPGHRAATGHGDGRPGVGRRRSSAVGTTFGVRLPLVT